MDVLTEAGKLLREFGLPIAMLVVFGGLIITDRLRSGKNVDADLARDAEQRRLESEFREKLRLEERTARLEAERRLDEALEVAKQAADLAARYEKIVREKIK